MDPFGTLAGCMRCDWLGGLQRRHVCVCGSNLGVQGAQCCMRVRVRLCCDAACGCRVRNCRQHGAWFGSVVDGDCSMSTDDKVSEVGPMTGTSDIHPLPSHCVRCRYDLTGVRDSRRVCPECGLENSAANLASIAQSLRREWRLGRWCTILSVACAAACAVAWFKIEQHSSSPNARWTPPAWLPVTLLVALCSTVFPCAVGCAIMLSARERVVHRSLGILPAVAGALLGLLLAAGTAILTIVLVYLGLGARR